MTNGPLDPAATIISRLGGPDAVVEITGADRTRVYRWTQPKDRHGTDGIIPFQHVAKLIEAAKSRGVALDANDFLPATPPQQVAE